MPKSPKKGVTCDDVCAHSFEGKIMEEIYKGINLCCTQINLI